MILIFPGIVVLAISFLFGPSILRIQANNQDKRRQTALYSGQATEDGKTLVREAAHISPFLVTEAISGAATIASSSAATLPVPGRRHSKAHLQCPCVNIDGTFV